MGRAGPKVGPVPILHLEGHRGSGRGPERPPRRPVAAQADDAAFISHAGGDGGDPLFDRVAFRSYVRANRAALSRAWRDDRAAADLV